MAQGEVERISMARIDIPLPAIEAFCRKWRVAELDLFGSVLREDFGPDSDVDLLVSFLPEARLSLLDQVRMERELSGILGRRVDLLSKRGLESSTNWIRRDAILASAEAIYVAG
ncbi:MAG: nucleotidyltransferase domain-containing protein [Rhodospirillales bacterium]|nr:nucleotidyltransferase domain-containing protein [Rhodospirillales bacterium]